MSHHVENMINLKKSGIGLVMVVDKNDKVIGTVSDGDMKTAN